MKLPPIHDELFELFGALRENQLDEQGRDRLVQWISNDPQAMQAYVYLTSIWGVLVQETTSPMISPANMATEGVLRRVTHRMSNIRFMVAAMAVAAMTVMALTAWFMGPTSTADHEPTAAASIAILTNTNHAVFAGESMQLGDALAPGPIRLTSGQAQIMFASDAVVDLTGPCDFEMTGANRGRLTSGILEAYVPEKASGFTIRTPSGLQVVDHGTKFSMYVHDADANHYVLVQQGRVEISSPLARTPTMMLDAGQIAVYQPGVELRQITLPLATQLVRDGDFTSPTTADIWSLKGNVVVGTRSRIANATPAVLLNERNLPPTGSMSQTLNTIPTAPYRLSLDIAKFGAGAGEAAVRIDLRDFDSHQMIASQRVSTDRSESIATGTLDFNAIGERTVLIVTDDSTRAGRNFDLEIHRVSVTPLPLNQPDQAISPRAR